MSVNDAKALKRLGFYCYNSKAIEELLYRQRNLITRKNALPIILIATRLPSYITSLHFWPFWASLLSSLGSPLAILVALQVP